MSERKVLNKYYPPDFDPSKIPRMKLARNRQYTVRLMAPFNMRCKTCGEYIYKGKKFNARKEDVEGDDYLGIRIYRFYIKCTRCLQEISFKTDPKNTDYEIEAGATRNFMALKLAEEQAQREEDEVKEEEATNPMKLLEKRTQQSKQELELLESLEELKDLNRRQQTIDYDHMLEQFDTEAARQRTIKQQEELDELYIQSIFGKKKPAGKIVEEEIVELEDGESSEPPKKTSRGKSSPAEKEEEVEYAETSQPTVPSSTRTLMTSSWSGNAGTTFHKTYLGSLVKKKISLGVKRSFEGTEAEPFARISKLESQTVVANADERVCSSGQASDTAKKADVSVEKKTSIESSGLSLLDAYTDSSENDGD